MALLSMTGFGRAEAMRGRLRVEVEISTLNRKQLDLRLSLPRGLGVLESRVASLLQQHLRRGQVTVNVRLTGAAPGGVLTLDRPLAKRAIADLRKAARALDLPDRLDTSVLLTIPGVLTARDPGQDVEQVWLVLRLALQRALTALIAMRKREGEALARDVKRRLAAMARSVNALAKRAPWAARRYEALLRGRMQEAGIALSRKDPQVLKEVLMMVERGDVAEELVRLRSHVAHAGALLRGQEPAGRPLDFLCQELLREINTVGSKCGDAQMARLVVTFKADLEALREQIQNVE